MQGATKGSDETADHKDAQVSSPEGILPRSSPTVFVKPSTFKFSEDGSVLACLHCPDASMMHQLHTIALPSHNVTMIEPPTSGDTEDNLSHEEQLRRERQRQMSVGITNYEWSNNKGLNQLMVVSHGNIFLGVCTTDSKSPARQPLFRLVFDKASTGLSGGAIDPHFSPDGTKVAFVQDSELYVFDVPPPNKNDVTAPTPVKPTQLTSGARGSGKTNGLSDFIAEEEMDRYRGFWWSPDSKYIAYVEVDESHIPKFPIMHQGKDDVQIEFHRYPFSGAENAKCRLGVVAIPEASQQTLPEPSWLSLYDHDDFYVARVDWLADLSLVVQLQNRDQDVLQLKQFHPTQQRAGSEGCVILEEKAKYWTNLHNNLRSFLYDRGDGEQLFLLFTSEANGFMHIYLWCVPPLSDGDTGSAGEIKAKLVHQITWGDWIVEDVVGMDLANGLVYFTGTATSPLERHLYVASLWEQSSAPEPSIRRLTASKGMHSIVMSADCKVFVDEFSSLQDPPQVHLHRVLESGEPGFPVRAEPNASQEGIGAQEALLCTLYVGKVEKVTTAPEIVEFSAADGKTTLYGAVYRPSVEKYGHGPYKSVVWVYGGPHVQLVNRRWALHMNRRVRMLNECGYLVFVCDNRGSNRRGADFEGAIKRNMGDIEVQDQVEGVKLLVSRKLTIPGKVGIFGWSYGGYMTCMCLARAPDVFAVGIAGAPVTHWDGYDTHYTERYMGTPQNNPEGYKVSSVMHHASKIEGRLMLIHGLVDENVHFRHTARLINSLIDGNVSYDLLLLPCERHSPRKRQTHIYQANHIMSFFQKNL